MKYTELERLAHELCDNLPENKAEGWNWWNIDGDARIHWLNEAHDQIVSKAKAEALTEAAESLEPSEADNPLLAALIKINPTAQMVFEYAREALTDRAQQLTEEP